MDMLALQKQLPWGIEYGEEFKQSAVAHKDFDHALKHVMKAAGKLSAMTEDADHGRKDCFPTQDVRKYLADLVICSMRMANVNQDGVIDLWKAVLERLEKKNGVKLT